MWLIAGLGNPGPVHRKHRHNVGFMALDQIVQCYWPMGGWRTRFDGETQELTIAGQKVLALKPQTFMNMSGLSVGDAASFYKIPPESVIVLHDDLDLDPGRVEVKQGGGNGGHNGLKSIDDRIGTGYWRIRLGLGHPVKLFPLANADKEQKQQMVLNHVLGNFNADELKQVEPALVAVSENIPLLLDSDAEGFRQALREAVHS